MAAPVRLVTGPRVIDDLDADRRRNGIERIVMRVQVGTVSTTREIELTERDLINLIVDSGKVLDTIRHRRENGQPLPGSGVVSHPAKVGRLPGDL